VQKHFELRAEQAGTVIKDDFVIGQMVNPEDVLFEISDLDHLWVEANIKPKDVSKVTIGSKASIPIDGKTLQGKVIFIGRILDEKTRTLPVRIEVNTKGASLYPGQFVKTSISGKVTHAAISIPAESVLRGADGDWMLFVEEAPGRFVPKEVDIIQNMGETVVVKGVESGTTIVSKGAFFVQSELAKSGFEVHNH
jgi:RND family efflux transporter MFP subunit